MSDTENPFGDDASSPSQGRDESTGHPSEVTRNPGTAGVPVVRELTTGRMPSAEEEALAKLSFETQQRLAQEAFRRRKLRQYRTSLILFLLTLLSTTLVGADYWPLDILPGFFNVETQQTLLEHFERTWPTEGTPTLVDRFWQSIRMGCTYSIPLMAILLCHEMGHYLQAVRYRVPASFPYFIPLPLPPLGTMGAVILQGRGAADRKKMFDIAVTGPLAGLVATIPILYFGIQSSGYTSEVMPRGFAFGQPLLIEWLIEAIHGPPEAGMTFHWNGYATAGWVGVFITAMNLLPIGQLDGGHILYTLIGRKAHFVAWGLIVVAVYGMIRMDMYSYILLLILLTLTGPRHPPTADDTVPLGAIRHVIGWATLAFLLIGFTLQPIIVAEKRPGLEPPGVMQKDAPRDGVAGNRRGVRISPQNSQNRAWQTLIRRSHGAINDGSNLVRSGKNG